MSDGRGPTSSSPSPPQDSPSAFISYSHVDREFAVRLEHALEARGKTAWLDETAIRGGTRWNDALQRAIQSADAFLFLLSPNSTGSAECGKELAYAIELGKRILPLRVAETPIETWPRGLGEYQLIPSRARFGEDFDAALTQLITEIETDRDWVREHTDWSEKALEWERHGRERSYLVAGAELTAAEAWRSRAAGKRPNLSTLQSEFVDASREWATRRLRRTRGVVSVGLGVAIVLSVIAFISRQQAINEQKVAKSGELSAQSQQALGNDPQLSLLLAAQAARVKQTAPALDALRRAIPQNHLLRTMKPNTQPLQTAQWSTDGTQILTAGRDGTIRVYTAATGAQVARFPLGNFYTQGAMFATHAPVVLGWGGNGVHVWSLAGARPATLTDGSFVKLQLAVISPDGTRVATTAIGGSGADLLFDARSGRLVKALARASIDGPSPVTTVAFSADGRYLAGASGDGTATVWDGRTGGLVRRLGPRLAGSTTDYSDSVAFSPDGTKLLSSPENGAGETLVWDLRSGRRTGVYNGQNGVWSPGSHYFATTTNGSATVYNARTGKALITLKGQDPIVGPVSFGPDINGQLGDIVTGSDSGHATVWNASSGGQLATLAGDAGSVRPAGYSPDGAEILTYSSDGAARIWDGGRAVAHAGVAPRAIDRLDPLSTVDPQEWSHPEPLTPLRAYGNTVHTPLRVYNVRTGVNVVTLPPVTDGGRYDNVAFDDAGTRMLVMTSSGTTIRPAELRHVRGGAVLHTLSGPGSHGVGGVLSPDGRLAAAVDRNGVIGVWDAASGRHLTTFTRHESKTFPAVYLKFSPDGTLLLSADAEGNTYVWRARTGVMLNHIHGEAEPSGMYQGAGGAISPDDKLVVTVSSWDNDARVYQVGGASKQEVTALSGHSVGITDATFNRDGTLIATVSFDGTIRVWDTQHPDALLTLSPSQSVGSQIQFSSDGRSLVTDTETGSETLPCVICGGFGLLLDAARRRETRGFTTAERSLYLTG